MYAVYGKFKDQEKARFKPLDMQNSRFVTNKIYMSVFTDNQLNELKKEVQAMNELNPSMLFEVRKA